jgi:predicted chitinase
LSWNYNYKAVGDAIGVDLLNNPDKVATDATIAWKTALHFWMTSTGAGSMTAHTGITCTSSSCGFGQTIRTINGSLECDGKNPSAVQSRVNAYKRFCDLLGVSYGNNLTC